MTKKCGCFFVQFEEDQCFCVDFGEIIMVEHGYNPYTGPYEVIPKWCEQELATNGKNMTDDVIVSKIPIQRILNDEGGNTVIIGG